MQIMTNYSIDVLNAQKRQQESIKNSEVKTILLRCLSQINAVIQILYIKKILKKCITFSTNILSSTIVFNIDNNNNKHIRLFSK